MGKLLLAACRRAEAEAAWREALALAPREAFLHHCLGTALAARAKYDEAAVATHQALAIDEQSAIVHLDTVLAITPENAKALCYRGLAAAKRGDQEEHAQLMARVRATGDARYATRATAPTDAEPSPTV